uniref:Uncharacterized protein n=1 Tax=viral metagenome TaxID=1070528 RepID=A0A6C0BPK7_9ZZZZ
MTYTTKYSFLFIILNVVSNSLLRSMPLLLPKDPKKMDDASYYERHVLTLVVFYYFIFLFGFLLLLLILHIMLNTITNFSFLYYFVLELLPHFISSLIIVIPIHFTVFLLYRQGYIDSRVFNFREEINSWIMLTTFVIFFSVVYSHQFLNNSTDDSEVVFSSDVVLDNISKKISTRFLEQELTYEELQKQYNRTEGQEPSLTGVFDDTKSDDLQIWAQKLDKVKSGIQNLLEAKEGTNNMYTRDVLQEVSNIFKIFSSEKMKQKKSLLFSQGILYSVVLFKSYMFISAFNINSQNETFKSVPGESLEDERKRSELKKNNDHKLRIITTVIKAYLVVVIMLSKSIPA